MKSFIAFVALLAVVAAKPGFFAPVAYSSQYHAQDNLGQYSYGYADHLSTKSEVKSFDGVTHGGYSYVDAEGKLQTVKYTADDVNGFQVSASNLPKAPEVPVVPDVPAIPEVPTVEMPKPVEDTPEVAAAKAKHLEAVKEAEHRAAVPEIVAPVVTAYAAPAVAYGYPAVHGFSYSTNNYAPFVSAYAAPYYHHHHITKVFA